MDAVRGVAMWMVVVSHFTLWFYTNAPERYWLSLPCQMIALPVFFFLSARMRRNTSWRAVGKRAIRFALITIAGTALLDLTLQIPFSRVLEPENLFFWFFVALIIFETSGCAIMHIIGRTEGRGRRIATASVLIILVQTIFSTAYRMTPELPVVPLPDLRNMWPCYAIGLMCTVMPELTCLLRGTPVFTVAMTVLSGAFMLTTATGDRIFILGAVGAVIVSCRISGWMRPALVMAMVGRQALWVYSLHPFLLTLIYIIINRQLSIITNHPWAIYPVCMAGAALICPAIALPIDRFAMWRKKRKFAAS